MLGIETQSHTGLTVCKANDLCCAIALPPSVLIFNGMRIHNQIRCPQVKSGVAHFVLVCYLLEIPVPGRYFQHLYRFVNLGAVVWKVFASAPFQSLAFFSHVAVHVISLLPGHQSSLLPGIWMVSLCHLFESNSSCAICSLTPSLSRCLYGQSKSLPVELWGTLVRALTQLWCIYSRPAPHSSSRVHMCCNSVEGVT